MTESAHDGSRPAGNLLLDISNAIVAIQKEYYGKGPTKARTYMADDLVLVVMQGGYSRAENRLVESGRQEAVIQTRLAIQETMEQTSIETIERLTGRTVRSFMSGNDPEQELQTEIFLLEGEPEPPDRADLAGRARAAREENVHVREDLRALRAEQAQSRAVLHRKLHPNE